MTQKYGALDQSNGQEAINYTAHRTKNYIVVSSNSSYVLSGLLDADERRIFEYNANKQHIRNYLIQNNQSFQTSSNAKFIKMHGGTKFEAKTKLQKGTIATPWSPYGFGTVETISKNGTNTSSNIVVTKPLCCIGDIKDEIDYTKGKIIRRCGYVIFDGSDDENWTLTENASGISRFNLIYNVLKNGSDFICNKFKTIKQSSNLVVESIIQRDLSNDKSINIRISNTRLSAISVQGFKAWLQSNPIVIVYELEIPIIENIECSNKIMQYDGETTVYNRDNAEIEVSLTNNKAISEINEDIYEQELVNRNKPEIITNNSGIAYKFPSGMLVCTGDVKANFPVTKAWGSLYELATDSTAGSTTFAVPFIAKPFLTATQVANGSGGILKDVTFNEQSISRVNWTRTSSGTAFLEYNYIAIGRWK